MSPGGCRSPQTDAALLPVFLQLLPPLTRLVLIPLLQRALAISFNPNPALTLTSIPKFDPDP